VSPRPCSCPHQAAFLLSSCRDLLHIDDVFYRPHIVIPEATVVPLFGVTSRYTLGNQGLEFLYRIDAKKSFDFLKMSFRNHPIEQFDAGTAAAICRGAGKPSEPSAAQLCYVMKNQIGLSNVAETEILYFKDFYGNPDTIMISVRLDVTQFDRLYLSVQTRNLIHPYSDSSACTAEVKCVKLEELLATKLKCLLQRRHLADLYDYVYAIFVNKELEVNKREIVGTFFRKTIFERSPRVVSGLLIGLPLEAFKDVWTKYLVCPKPSFISFESALANFVQNVKELFGEVIPHFGRSIFFPAELRNPIIDAGSSMTLLAVTYDGVRRMVEPYSLSYKQRKDGHAEEYFFCYDRTGGRSSPPGIKTFVSSKVQQIERLDEKFEPRFPVELSKSGERGDKTYFGASFSSGRSHVARSRHIYSSGTVYIIQCSYCGKRFRRTKPDTQLNKHKDKYKNPCYGRSGFRVF